MEYKKLQNGSDIRGVALEGIAGQTVNLTEEVCKNIGRGFALWLKEKTGRTDLRVAVGRDSRLSGPALCTWICDALVQQGVHVTDFGMASTPAMFMATVTRSTLPVRSPLPNSVPSTRSAPARIPSSVSATPHPLSLWGWMESTTLSLYLMFL